MHKEYRSILADLEGDPAVRVVVVTGTPPAFCVGGDSQALAAYAERAGYHTGLTGDEARPGYGVRPEFDHEFAFQFGMRMPIIAAINGACAGVGLALAMFCDLRFASAPARLTTAASKIGLPAEYGLSWILPRLIGVARANDLLLSGRVFTPDETQEWGLWNGVQPDAQSTLEVAREYARQLAVSAGPKAVRMTKRQIYDDLLSHDVGASITTSKALTNQAMAGAEYREGVAALIGKRAPQF
jgi:enoyl-CoA hydratase/carnithine racemase